MMAWVRRQMDALRGRGEAAPTVPPMDGVLKPNTLLEAARQLIRVEAPDNLVMSSQSILFSSGNTVHVLDAATGSARELRRFDHVVSCLAAGDAGLLAAGLDDGSIHLWASNRESVALTTLGSQRLVCPTALAFRAASTLIVCQGSMHSKPSQWKHDLMQRGASGSVWAVSLNDQSSRKLAGALAFPNGIALSDAGIVVSESWRHRLLRLSDAGTVPMLADLPGYPGRLSVSADGGHWLSVFAPRSQLIEFVLRETEYRERMVRELDPEHWISPTLAPARSFLEPMQGGALRTHGVMKPWAPTRSYGLLIRLDAEFRPIESYHSRADGTHHGVTSALEVGPQVLVASQGGNAILALNPDAQVRGVRP